ncbi:DNA mismatch repair endonuclease MutL [Myxococcota bacterium]|nr:DNA mismatch repair endonuclease MutL [Myxococcota bacterium]
MSKRRIARLPEALIDQIAAGEVVERPASVVKELVENALDADARRVRIEIRGGGQDLVAVSDDGCGMAADEARLAVQRHATSKLSAMGDLPRIATYGFRGEALPAIASVSRFRLRSRPETSEAAIQIDIDSGRPVAESMVSAPVGTRVEVADLFHAIPARRKFLKRPTTEWGHISDWLTRAALALPEVAFEIRRDDRPAQVWPAVGDLLDRVAAVLNEEEAAAFVAIESGNEGRGANLPRLQGFVSRPDRHRSTQAGIRLFVNRRPVRDRLFQHALVEVYRDVLPRGRFPSAVLMLDIPPDQVDVNVHPAKWEVRFADPQAIHRVVRDSVRTALGKRSWLGTPPELSQEHSDRRQPRTEWGQSDTDHLPAAQPPSDWVLHSAGETLSTMGTAADGGTHGYLGDDPLQHAEAPLRFGDLHLLGQALGTYLLVESKEGLTLIDQHAAHERVLYERLRAEWLDRGVERQGLLTPTTVQLDALALAAIEESSEEIWKLGFDVEPFGDDTVAVRAVPALLSDHDPAQLVRGLAEEIAQSHPGADASRPEARMLDAADRIFATLACHSARRKGDILSIAEQRALIKDLDAIPWAPTCPHGRPVAIALESAELERRFARR